MARCRSCGAEILWAVTKAGKRIPIDPEPEPYGNVQLDESAGEVRATVVAIGDGTHVSHFASCPLAYRHRS